MVTGSPEMTLLMDILLHLFIIMPLVPVPCGHSRFCVTCADTVKHGEWLTYLQIADRPSYARVCLNKKEQVVTV